MVKVLGWIAFGINLLAAGGQTYVAIEYNLPWRFLLAAGSLILAALMLKLIKDAP